MREGSARASDDAAAQRKTRLHATRTALARVASGFLGLLLVMQLAGAFQHAPRHAAPTDARTIALAGLGAAIGQPVALCEHGDPSRPDDPARSGGCDHCVFCHAVAVGIPAKAILAVGIVRVATAPDAIMPVEDVAFGRSRLFRGATPRGPPVVG